jgi:hypothetical protein
MKEFNVKDLFRVIANKFCYQYMGEEWPLGPHCALTSGASEQNSVRDGSPAQGLICYYRG